MKNDNMISQPLRVAVYCSSVEDLPEKWKEGARVTGEWIGRNGATLVYGGVNSGLMRVTAESAKAAGAKIVGVVPTRRLPAASPLNDMQVPTSDLNDRKGTMQLLGDVFVVLPGGYGTLDEFTTSFSYINFTDQLTKSIIVFSPDGLYDHLIAHLHRMADLRLMAPERLSVLTVVDTPERICEELDRIKASIS